MLVCGQLVAVVAVSVTVVVIAFVVPVAVIIAIVSATMIAVVLVLAVVVAVIVAVLFAIFVAAELPFPAAMASPVGVLSANGKWAVIAEPRIEVTIDVTAESDGTVEPGTSSEKHSAAEPCGSVVAEGSAAVRRVVVVAVRADGLDTDVHRNLYFAF